MILHPYIRSPNDWRPKMVLDLIGVLRDWWNWKVYTARPYTGLGWVESSVFRMNFDIGVVLALGMSSRAPPSPPRVPARLANLILLRRCVDVGAVALFYSAPPLFSARFANLILLGSCHYTDFPHNLFVILDNCCLTAVLLKIWYRVAALPAPSVWLGVTFIFRCLRIRESGIGFAALLCSYGVVVGRYLIARRALFYG